MFAQIIINSYSGQIVYRRLTEFLHAIKNEVNAFSIAKGDTNKMKITYARFEKRERERNQK